MIRYMTMQTQICASLRTCLPLRACRQQPQRLGAALPTPSPPSLCTIPSRRAPTKPRLQPAFATDTDTDIETDIEKELLLPGQTTFGEDSAVFDVSAQRLSDWAVFFALLTVVLGGLYVAWIAPGVGIGTGFVDSIESLAHSSEATMLAILFIFAIAHSGLAYARPFGEDLIGARAYRVIFALVSLPLATAAVVYFINHRYDGTPLWNIRGVTGVHESVFTLSFLSFYFLYPSTFNILEVAAVDEPKLHLWETGIIRITRHPQAVGQFLWCLAHTAWVGSSFMVAASLGLMAHHAFGCWHGDYRLERKYGAAFEQLKERTSTVPFVAIWEGRQQVPKDYWKEFLRGPYLFLVPFCIGCYVCHPLMQRGALALGW